jgi:nitrogen fixation/metabolism regulation signal transduction histidine kinase
LKSHLKRHLKTEQKPEVKTRIRHRVLTFVGALIVLSLFASTLSLVQISHVNQTLEEINRVSMPVSRLFSQMQIDAEVFRRELNRGLGSIHWNDAHWAPRPVPQWITEVIDHEILRARDLLQNSELSKAEWSTWGEELATHFATLKEEAQALYQALDKKDQTRAAQIYPRWTQALEEWSRKLQWGVNEHERVLRERFSSAQTQVSQLRTGLEAILLVVVCLSFLLLWLGERALRPLSELTHLAREITRRGLKREDKGMLLEIPVGKDDEVSALAREFHAMATQLLEREKVVEDQKTSLEEQNLLLKTMGGLNETVLNSIRSILIVTDLSAKITQANPVALRWLGTNKEKLLGSTLSDWPKLSAVLVGAPGLFTIDSKSDSMTEKKIEHQTVDGRTYGGQVFPLVGTNQGAIIVLEDLTHDLALEERLRQAENLASVGRLSAQVAHEVRNPLHAIGLETEIAIEQSKSGDHSGLKQSLQSILSSVDRLESITENYLKLSRMSSGSKTKADMSLVLQNVLAAFTSLCEKYRVRVDWKIEAHAPLMILGDIPLLEQALGNLLQNSIQAMEGQSSPHVTFKLSQLESGRISLMIQDEGPGISQDILDRLFTPFMTTKAQGTGLGLSFVKKVIEDHGGEITYVPTPVGACFQIVLPLGESERIHHGEHGENLISR